MYNLHTFLMNKYHNEAFCRQMVRLKI